MAWLEPELDDGPDDGPLRPLELLELLVLELLELEPDEFEPDEPEPVLEVPEPEPADPELVLPLAGELPDVEEFVFVDEALPVEPGRASATAPAASKLATPTVAVVALIRPLPRWRAAFARAMLSGFGVFMTEVSPPALGGISAEFLSRL